LDNWIRDPGWGKISGSGFGMKNPDHNSESLETIFWVKILKFFDADPGSKKKKIGFRSRDKYPGPATLLSGSAGSVSSLHRYGSSATYH
jgi:hypothetical protein